MNISNCVERKQNRLAWIDSIKGIFILLVVFGHLTAGEGGVGTIKLIEITRYLIYSFHMPMFILITGLFSKNLQNVKGVISNYIVPYIVFDSMYVLWCVVVGKEANLFIIIPTYVYWYILCIAFQKILVSKISNKLLLFFLIISLQIGTIFVSENVWRVLSFGRVALLFPIFYIGYLIPISVLHEMRRKKFLSICIGFISIGVNMILYKVQLVPISATHNYYTSFAELGIKYIYMLTTLGLFISLNAIVPDSKVLSRCGRNSLIVYLAHPFFVDVIGYAVRHFIKSNYLSAVIFAVSSVLITYILSFDIFKSIYDLCMNKINKVLNLAR